MVAALNFLLIAAVLAFATLVAGGVSDAPQLHRGTNINRVAASFGVCLASVLTCSRFVLWYNFADAQVIR